MSESNLNLPMDSLKGEIGDYLGWGRGAAEEEEAWTTDKDKQLVRLLNTALRWVYDSAVSDPGAAPHQWSWLTPSTSVVIPAAEKVIKLPDDFGGYVSKWLLVTREDTGSVRAKVPLVGEPYIDQMYARSPTTSGRPVYAAERVGRGNKPNESTRSELYVYPVPDAAYTLRGQYNLVARALTAASPFPYGDAKMASCYQAACRAAAEMYEDNLRPGEGTEWPIFQRELAAAILRDGRHHPKTLGKNADRSDPSRSVIGGRRGWWTDGVIGFLDPVTVNGESPG